MSSLDDSSMAESRPDEVPNGGSSRASARPTPYARPAAAVEGQWKHDRQQAELPRRGPRGEDSRRAGGRDQAGQSAKLLITNLHYDVSESELKKLFGQIGEIVAGPKIRYDRSGRSRGLAWVTYATEEQAREAKDAFDGAPAKGEPIRIVYDLSYRPAPAPGTLLARLAADDSQSNSADRSPRRAQRDWDAPRSQPPANAPKGPRAVGAAAVRGVGGAGGRRGPREPRVKQAPKTQHDLDRELDEYLSKPAEPAPAKAADVEMS